MNEHVNRLSAELTAMQIDDAHGLISFLPLSARLAVLDDRCHLRHAMEKARGFPDIEGLLLDRCKEGVWDIRSALGEFLALAIISAQDFACLLDLEHCSFSKKVELAIQSWVEHAESASLDGPAVSLLETFLERFPIPESHRLGIVDSPLEETEREILAEAASWMELSETIEVAVRPQPVRAEEFAFADAGEVPAWLVDNWSVAERNLSAPGVGDFVYSQRLYPEWRLVIDITLPNGAGFRAESVRVGPFLATRETDSPGRWGLDLRNYPRNCRTRAIDEAVVITIGDGIRMKVL